MKEIDIVTVSEEDRITKPERPIELDQYPDIDPQITWELANLIRIAGTDYQCFNDWFDKVENEEVCQEFTLEQDRSLQDIKLNNSWLYVEKISDRKTLTKYTLLNQKDLENPDLIAKFPDETFYKYKIVKTYEYVSYYPLKADVNVDRFGFIAERYEGDKKYVFVVFRGTRELGEWFSNAQFKQVDFLTNEDDADGLDGYGSISLGFNKMYTGYRPGVFIEYDSLNEASRRIDASFRRLFKRIEGFNFNNRSVYQAIKEYFSATNVDKNTNIYVTGHSLGGALATIAAMDIVAEHDIDTLVNLYTFASPRVGDNVFADKFNEFVSDNKIQAFRFANSEDIVTKIPFPVWFKAGIDLDKKSALELARNTFNQVTGGIFEADYQHVGVPVYFTHQARRIDDDGSKRSTATISDNHNMTVTYCGALQNNG